MDEIKKIVVDLQKICERQYTEIEIKKIQFLDLEEENRVLKDRIKTLQELSEKDMNRIDELERWCGHLQGIIDKNTEENETRIQQYQKLEKRFGVFFKIARKIYRKLIK